MAAVQSTFGGILLALAILLLLAGAAAAAYAMIDEDDNQDQGLFRDGDRSDVNEALTASGIIVAGVGFVLLIVAIVLLATSRPQPAVGPDGQPVGPSATGGQSVSEAAGPAHGAGKSRTVGIVAVSLAALLSVVLLMVAFGGGNGGLLGERDPVLGEEEATGRIPSQILLGGQRGGLEENQPATVGGYAEARQVQVVVEWERAIEMALALQIETPDGWETIAQGRGPSGTVLTLDGPSAETKAATAWRVTAEPQVDGVFQEMEYRAVFTFFR